MTEYYRITGKGRVERQRTVHTHTSKMTALEIATENLLVRAEHMEADEEFISKLDISRVLGSIELVLDNVLRNEWFAPVTKVDLLMRALRGSRL